MKLHLYEGTFPERSPAYREEPGSGAEENTRQAKD